MYAVGDEINVPDISDYFSVAIAAEEVIDFKIKRLAPQNVDTHIVFIEKPDKWWAIRVGEHSKNFKSIADEYAIYENENGVIIPVNKLIKTSVLEGDVLERVTGLIQLFEISNPLVLFTGKGATCLIEPSEPRYICFKVVPRQGRPKNIEQITIDYFWEIISFALTSDRKTIFEVKMNL